MTLVLPRADSLEQLAFEAGTGLWAPEITTKTNFGVVGRYVEVVLDTLGATAEVVAPSLELLEGSWNPSNYVRTQSNRQTVIDALEALPNALANAATIDRVTGTHTDEVVVAEAVIFHDIGKDETDQQVVEDSQAGRPFPISRLEIISAHVKIGKQKIEESRLPVSYRGQASFRQLVADVVGETHEVQPPPSMEYGCGHKLGNEARRVRDAVSSADWRGAKFGRDNDGNRDEDGKPLSDLVRSRQFLNYLFYLVKDYWYVSPSNNAGEVALALYETNRSNHPDRIYDLGTVMSLGHTSLSLVA